MQKTARGDEEGYRKEKKEARARGTTRTDAEGKTK